MGFVGLLFILICLNFHKWKDFNSLLTQKVTPESSYNEAFPLFSVQICQIKSGNLPHSVNLGPIPSGKSSS